MVRTGAAGVLMVLLSSVAHAELVMVYSIQRHGARNVLPKTSILQESDYFGGPTLLPQGKKMCYEAGVDFRRRYLDRATCNDICLTPEGGYARYGVVSQPNATYSNYNTLVNSSALHRTILSADSFLTGVFSPSDGAECSTMPYLAWQMVPVFSKEDSEDYMIRGYTKCPSYDRRLMEWYGSEDFKAKEAETEGLRDRVHGVAPELNTSLANWWNVYDEFNVWRKYGVGTPMPDMDEQTFQKVVDVAMWLETAKMRSNLTSSMLGGALLGDVLHRMNKAALATRTSGPTYYRLLSVSSHYNTQLGVLSALNVDQVKGSTFPWLHKIPALAAVLVFELHKDTNNGGYWVRVVAQDGPGKPYVGVPLPCSSSSSTAGEGGGRGKVLTGQETHTHVQHFMDAADAHITLGGGESRRGGDSQKDAEAAANGVGLSLSSLSGACRYDEFFALAKPQALTSVEQWCGKCGNVGMLSCRAVGWRRGLRGVE